MLFIFIFIISIINPIEIISTSNHQSPELRMRYGGYALNALEQLLNFFESDANNINLDGLYGLRIAQGQLDTLSNVLTSSSKHKLTDKNNFIYSLFNKIEHIANMSLNEIARDSPIYLHRFSLIAYQPFRIEYKSRKLDKNYIEIGERNSNFDEEESDKCFGELLGSNNHSSKCFISKACWNMMTSPKSKDYRLTHQLLWFLIAKTIGCIKKDHANENLIHFEDYFCMNTYEDAKYNLLNNINQDLFLEQLLLCSIIGYEEFLRFDWLDTILTWQDPTYGCFSDASETIRFHHKIKRNLLFEQEMNNGCLSHKSGLAAGLLATYSRVFLQ